MTSLWKPPATGPRTEHAALGQHIRAAETRPCWQCGRPADNAMRACREHAWISCADCSERFERKYWDETCCQKCAADRRRKLKGAWA